METTTISSREFNQDIGKAKRAADNGPVYITNRGQPSYVLLKIEDFQKISGNEKKITELIAMTNADQIDFDPPRLGEQQVQGADLG